MPQPNKKNTRPLSPGAPLSSFLGLLLFSYVKEDISTRISRCHEFKKWSILYASELSLW